MKKLSAAAEHFVKEAILERLVRLGATDVPGTPRLLMKHRSPEELAALQHGVTGAFQQFEEPAKKAVHGLIDKIPHAGAQRVLKGGANMMIENPEMIPMQAIPVPGASLAYLGAKKGLERGLDRLAPIPKVAFSTNAFSGPMNPVIATGASDLPPFKKPSLQAPVQKVAFKLHGHIKHQGLGIAVENRKGSVRKGVDKDGKPWRTKMKFPYGYIKGTRGADGEEVDCYVGPVDNAEFAYVVHQKKEDGSYDEDKVMLGFASEEDAKKGYLAHYNTDKFLGPIKKVPMSRLFELISKRLKLVKIADAEADNPGQKKPGLIAPTAVAALGGLQVVGVPDAATKMLGYQPIHHGTSNEAAEKIRQVGLDPSMGGSPHGASAAVGDAEYVANSKGHVHVAPKKSMASDYATIAEAAGEARKAGRPFGSDEAVSAVIEDNLRGKQRGSILSGAMPYDEFKENFHPDPDTSGGLRSTQKVSPEVFKTGLKDVAQKALKDPKSVGSFIKKHPSQFARGVAGIAVPAAMMAGGGMWLHHNIKKRREQEESNKTAASSPTRGGFMLASDIPAFKSPSLAAPVEKNGDMLPDYVSTNDGVGFKRSKYARFKEDKLQSKRTDGSEYELDRSQGNSLTNGEVPMELKVADISPTAPLGDGGGNPHRAQSDLPPFRTTSLRTPLTKVSEFSDISAYNGGPSSAGRAPVNEAGFRQAGDQPGIPVNSLRAPLIKRGSLGLGTNPMGAAHAAKSVGTAPAIGGGKGPDIAQIAKPKGKGFGGPLPGANKSTIGTLNAGAGT